MKLDKNIKEFINNCLLNFPNNNICKLEDINKDTQIILYCNIKNNQYNYYTTSIEKYINTYVESLKSFFKQKYNISNNFSIDNKTYGVCKDHTDFKGFCYKQTFNKELYQLWWTITTFGLIYQRFDFDDINKWYITNKYLLDSLVLLSLYCSIKQYQKTITESGFYSRVEIDDVVTIEESDVNIKNALISFIKNNNNKVNCIEYSVFDTIKQLINLEKNKILSYKEIKPFIYKCYSEQSFKQIITILNIYGDIINYKNLSKNFFPTTIVSSIIDNDSFYFMKTYFKFIQNFESNSIFSLGDSLDKYNTVWNSINSNKPIKIIPMSGSQYYDSGTEEKGDRKLIRDDENYNGIETNIKTFYTNNSVFRELISSLQKGEKVLLTDFGHTGKAVVTIINIISKFVDDLSLSNITFLSAIEPDNNYYKNNVKKLIKHKINVEYIKVIFDPYYTNSERTKSRCIPRYTWKMWKNKPNDVWKDDGVPNYYMCNLHRTLMMMMLCCKFKNENFFQLFE